MIEAVLIFGLMNIAFEFVLLSMLSPRIRLRILGSPTARVSLHFALLFLNLVIHWGTLIGTMSGIFAFIGSILTVKIARVVYGYIEHGRYYTVGIKRFNIEELT